MNVETAREVLGVSPGAEREAIDGAYRALSRKYHPDIAGPDGEARMKEITEAKAVLEKRPAPGYTVREPRAARRPAPPRHVGLSESVPAVAVARDGVRSLAVGDGRPAVALGVLVGLMALMLTHAAPLSTALLLAYVPASFPTGMRVWVAAGSWTAGAKLCPTCGRPLGEIASEGLVSMMFLTLIIGLIGAVGCPFETGWVIGEVAARRVAPRIPWIRG
jgi:hypothetical protein